MVAVGEFVEYHGSLPEHRGPVYRVVAVFDLDGVPCCAIRGQRVMLSNVRQSSVRPAPPR